MRELITVMTFSELAHEPGIWRVTSTAADTKVEVTADGLAFATVRLAASEEKPENRDG